MFKSIKFNQIFNSKVNKLNYQVILWGEFLFFQFKIKIIWLLE